MSDQLVRAIFVCPVCKREHYAIVTESEYNRIINRGHTDEHIQDILSDYSDTIREKFLTGFCESCQDDFFSEEEEECTK